MKKSVTLFLVLILLICCLTSCDFFESLQSEATTKAAETTQSPEHVHNWLSATGEHARICADCDEKQLIPEACDWQYVGQISDCWSTTITYACSQCHEEQLVHGDSVLPSHIWEEETADGKTTFNCTRCKESIIFVSEIGTFDYAQVLEQYKIGDLGVKHENFYNPEVERETTSAIDAIIRAKFDVTVEYDTISVTYDESSSMWRVDFWTQNLDGNSQSIYVNEKGFTCYSVYIGFNNGSDSGYEAGLKMLRYNWFGYGVGQKDIYTCDLGYAILDCLSKLQETGEVIPKISDDVVNEFVGYLPIENGTVWLECGTVGLFRLNPAMTEICIVQTHLGEGKVLQMTDELAELLQQAWYYHPYDYWSGTYENGTVTLQQIYKKDSAVEWVTIEDVHIENTHHSQNNQISLLIRAANTQTVEVCLESYQSDDNLGSFDCKEITLVGGEEISVDFTFTGFYNYTYWVSITIDNTKINLAINPKGAE